MYTVVQNDFIRFKHHQLFTKLRYQCVLQSYRILRTRRFTKKKPTIFEIFVTFRIHLVTRIRLHFLMKVFTAFLPWLNMKVVVRPEPKLPLTLQTENKAQPDFLTLLRDSLYKATCGNIGQMQRLVPPLKRHTAVPLRKDWCTKAVVTISFLA